MSKLFSGKKYFLKPVKGTGNKNMNINQSIPEVTDLYSKKDQTINHNIVNTTPNKNNMTIDSPKHYSPTSRSLVSLPPISSKNRKLTNTQKKNNSKKIGVSNSSSNIHSGSLFGPNNRKVLEREKTQFNLLNNNENEDINIDKINEIDPNLNFKNNRDKIIQNANNNNLNNITQINNITNINIHVYSGATNKTVDNINNREILKNPLLNVENNYGNNINNINNMNILQNQIYPNNKNQNSFSNVTTSVLGNNGLSIINNNQKLFSNMSKNYSPNKKKYIKGNIKIMPNSNNSINTTKNTNDINNGSSFSTIGSMIMNSNNITTVSQRGISQNKDNKFIDAPLPDIYTGRSCSIKKNTVAEKNINNLLQEKGLMNPIMADLENIDIGMNFLKDLSSNNNTFIYFLQLLQNHMDIELLLDSCNNNNSNNYRSYGSNTISNDKLYILNNLLNNYFDTLSMIYTKKDNFNTQTVPIDNFFLYTSINNVFHKCIKIEICLNAAILITLSQLSLYEINSMIKNHFHKIIKEISSPLLNLFETFIKEELNLNYPELITLNLRPDFNENFIKLFKDQKITHSYKNSELLNIISKNVDKCVNSMKYYSTLNLKCSLIKPFGDSLNQLLYSIERKTLNQFGTIALKTLLFGELDSNRKISMQNCSIPLNDINAKNELVRQSLAGLSLGSAIFNKINEIPPFLPPINPKYKYTLVLDMDETLIHYFFTHKNGMFFVRPYCFDFLYELNDLYEIITFTAGTKEYADNILNLLDINNNLIKYRLYRQHTTILGRSVFKDLSKLGRDLRKVIIIDNLKENFKIQPNNGIYIKTWTNDINDTQFRDLLKILKDIVLLNVNDVRNVIQKMNDENKINRNIINPYAHVNVAKLIGKTNNFK